MAVCELESIALVTVSTGTAEVLEPSDGEVFEQLSCKIAKGSFAHYLWCAASALYLVQLVLECAAEMCVGRGNLPYLEVMR